MIKNNIKKYAIIGGIGLLGLLGIAGLAKAGTSGNGGLPDGTFYSLKKISNCKKNIGGVLKYFFTYEVHNVGNEVGALKVITSYEYQNGQILSSESSWGSGPLPNTHWELNTDLFDDIPNWVKVETYKFQEDTQTWIKSGGDIIFLGQDVFAFCDL